jgi:hypothetical protein
LGIILQKKKAGLLEGQKKCKMKLSVVAHECHMEAEARRILSPRPAWTQLIMKGKLISLQWSDQIYLLTK